MKVKTLIVYLAIFSYCFVLPSFLWAGSAFMEDKAAQALADTIYYECINADYDAAIKHNHELISQYPAEPLPRLFLSTIYMYMVRSYWDYPVDDKYHKYKKKFILASLL